jgi:hypothetical protein
MLEDKLISFINNKDQDLLNNKEFLKILNNYEQVNLSSYFDGDIEKLVIAKGYEGTDH